MVHECSICTVCVYYTVHHSTNRLFPLLHSFLCVFNIQCIACFVRYICSATWKRQHEWNILKKHKQKTTTKQNKKWTTKNNTTTPQHHHHRKTSVPLDNVDGLGWNILSGRGSQCFDGRVQSSTCIHVGTCSPLNKTYCSVPTKDDPQTHCTDCRRHLPEMQPTKQYCAS